MYKCACTIMYIALFPSVMYTCSKEVDVGEEGDMWWMGRGDFSAPRGHTDQSGSTETDQSDADSMKVVEGEDGEVRSKVIPNWSPPEERVGQFTNYSISSSVVPRNKGEEGGRG